MAADAIYVLINLKQRLVDQQTYLLSIQENNRIKAIAMLIILARMLFHRDSEHVSHSRPTYASIRAVDAKRDEADIFC